MNRMNDNAEDLYSLAQQFALSGRFTQAIEHYSSAILLSPNHVKAYCGRGMALQRIGEHAKAIADLDEVISSFPDWSGAFVAFYCRARSRQALGQNAEAIVDCDSAISKNPELIDAFYLRGTARKALGHIESAVNDMDAVLTLDPSYFEAHLERGKLSLFRHQWKHAIQDFSAAIEHIGANTHYLRECLYLRGMASQELGEHRAAISDFTRTIDLLPSDGGAYLRRARSHHELGESTLGDADFQFGTRLIQGQ
jgi:tetratricopeptide (TPR) repeat protein